MEGWVKLKSEIPLRDNGFRGFITVGELQQKIRRPMIPISEGGNARGVYVVLYPFKERPELALNGENGFNGGNPKPSKKELESKWVEGTDVVYIGQTGGAMNGALTNGRLGKRIHAYLRYGRKGKGGHAGGRYIWYLSRAEELVFCWKPFADKGADPKELECHMLRSFMNSHENRLPFANHKFECTENDL